ncbi:MAG: murein biosynthesis integral membrane protein MurJ [Clostridiales bacterium]|nr:murein biosynthesis integral membrane protein MurJ [Clostridiales bacterium]
METQGRTTVVKAAGLLMASTIVSRILGYLRDILIAAAYGQTRVTDAYFAAFSIPDFLYNLLAAGTVTAAFIPVFSGYIATDRQDEGWEVANTVFHLTVAAMLCGIAAAGLLAPQIVANWLVPGFEPEYTALTVHMTRIMLIQSFFMALNGISMGILNSYQRFVEPALAAVMYNVMIILFGVVLGKKLGITGFSIGVVAGSITQFLIQVMGLRHIGLRYKPVLNWRHPGVRQVFALMVPVLLSYALTQIGLFVQQNISSSFPDGYLSSLKWAQRLMQMPVSIFAVTMVMALFPTLTGQAARQEMEAFKKSFSFGLRSIVYITLPCAVGLAVLSRPVVSLLYERGSFGPEDAALTANTLVFFCLGLFAQGGVLLMNRVFYALKNSWTPVGIGAAAMVLNILLNYLLRGPLNIGGLALAYSITGMLNLAFLLAMARRKIGAIGDGKLAASFGKILGISLIMGLVVYAVSALCGLYLVDTHTKAGQLTQVLSAVAVGVPVYMGLSVVLKMEESDVVWRMFRRSKRV